MQFIIIGITLLFMLIPISIIILYAKAIKKRKEDITKERELRDKTIEYLYSLKDKGE